MRHSVYVMCHEKDGKWCAPVKVGITFDPEKRLRSLQTGNPNKIVLLWHFPAPDREISHWIEQGFHQSHRAERLQGEWFNIEPIRAVQIICLQFELCLHVAGASREIARPILEICRVPQASMLWKPAGTMQ